MNSPRPLVDDQFWFNESKSMISGGNEKRNEAASLLQSSIGWLWGIYTGGTFIGLSISEVDYSFIALIIIVSPSPVLIVGYWFSVWAQIPLDIEFDPRSPTEIMQAYSKGNNIKSKRLKIALGTSFLAAALVSTSLITASIERSKYIITEECKKNQTT